MPDALPEKTQFRLAQSGHTPGTCPSRPAGDVVIPRRILVVDDEPIMRTMLVRCMSRLGHLCAESESALEALELAKSSDFDVVLTDFRMPGMGGMELLMKLKEMDNDLPVIIISGHQELVDAVQAMKLGADDYLLKPLVPDTVQLSIDRALSNRALKSKVRAYQGRLEAMVKERTAQIQCLFMNVIQSLIHTLEAKDPYTNGHSKRVAWLAHKLGQAMDLAGEDLDVIQLAAILHDLGKIGISETVLHKNGVLTDDEYRHIREHPTLGVRILEPLQELKPILPLIRHHHERYDGEGYPDGLKGKEIPLGARIISVADAFDAMMSARPHRSAISPEVVCARLEAGSGSQFDPQLIDRFLQLSRENSVRQALVTPHWNFSQEEHMNLPSMDYANCFLREQAVSKS